MSEYDTPTIPCAPVQRVESVKPVGQGAVIGVLALAIVLVAGVALAALNAATSKPSVTQPAPSTVTHTVTTGAPAIVAPTRARTVQEVGVTSSSPASSTLPSMVDTSSSPVPTESTVPSEPGSSSVLPSTTPSSSTVPTVTTQEEEAPSSEAPASPASAAMQP